MTFYVGQKVVCVRSGTRDDLVFPVVGSVYTIREFTNSTSGVGLRLVEIINPKMIFREGFAEASFYIGAFRPLVERKTDISVFNEMLRKATRRIDA